MIRRLPLTIFLCVSCLIPAALAAAKEHVLTYGKWTSVPFFVGPTETKKMEIKIRPLYVDGKLREFTTGDPHDVTDRLFVLRRAYRLNDWLPDDVSDKSHRWKWQRGGWLLVDRLTGHVTQITLPDFDPFYSGASWFRDYVAYCGVSDDGEKVFAVVAQIGRRKPLLKKQLGAAKMGDLPESECDLPKWERQPARVTFVPNGGQAYTFEVRTRDFDIAPPKEEEKSDEQ